MRPDDVYALTRAEDPRLSPDGRLIAYVAMSIDEEESAYRSAIWVVPVDGSEEPRQFTSGERLDRLLAIGELAGFASVRRHDVELTFRLLLVVAVTGRDEREPAAVR